MTDEETPEKWFEVDRYLCDQLVPKDPILEQALASSLAAGLPEHNVAPNQGKLLALLVEFVAARRVLEIGTLGGYSTIWLGRALPSDGTLDTLESNPTHAAVARENIARARLDDRVEVHEGAATESLAAFAASDVAPYDLVFIDADKPSNPSYLKGALALSRPGTMIVVDNVIRQGKVADATSKDPNVIGVRRMNEMIANDARLNATAIQTVGSKGYDGFALIRVLET